MSAERKCLGCGKTFTPNSARQIYCSRFCAKKHVSVAFAERRRAKQGPFDWELDMIKWTWRRKN
jgi:hypothetical protein